MQNHFQRKVNPIMPQGIPPRLMLHGALLGMGAIFFLIPGLLVDLLAVMVLAPMVRGGLLRLFGGPFAEGFAEERQRRATRAAQDNNVIEGEYTRLDTKDKK